MKKLATFLKETLSKLSKDQGYFRRVLMVPMCVVVFATVYMLILPALTIDHDTADDMPGMDVAEELADQDDLMADQDDLADWEEEILDVSSDESSDSGISGDDVVSSDEEDGKNEDDSSEESDDSDAAFSSDDLFDGLIEDEEAEKDGKDKDKDILLKEELDDITISLKADEDILPAAGTIFRAVEIIPESEERDGDDQDDSEYFEYLVNSEFLKNAGYLEYPDISRMLRRHLLKTKN